LLINFLQKITKSKERKFKKRLSAHFNTLGFLQHLKLSKAELWVTFRHKLNSINQQQVMGIVDLTIKKIGLVNQDAVIQSCVVGNVERPTVSKINRIVDGGFIVNRNF
jgi:hypothetical protein